MDSVKISSVDYDVLIESITKSCEQIKKVHGHVQKILLFGSFLKQNYTPESDVDILIIVEDDDTHFLKRKDLFSIFFEDIPFDVNIAVYTTEELGRMLKEGNLFIKSVLSEAREL